MTKLPAGLILLSQKDTDAPDLSAIGCVSKHEVWDDGGYLLLNQSTAAVRVDRPYFTGAGGDALAAAIGVRAGANAARRIYTQDGNEENLPSEGWVGGPSAYRSHLAMVRKLSNHADFVLHAPISPVEPIETTFPAWLVGAGPYAVHAYGPTAEAMWRSVAWYLGHTIGDLYITECNPGAGARFDLGAWARNEFPRFLRMCAGQPRIKCVLYFAWRWDQSKTLPSSVNACDCPAVVSALRATPEVSGVLRGLDVSNWQSEVGWPAVAASGVSFAIAKATEGADFTDPYFAANWRGMRAAELSRGAYLFARPDRAGPAEHVALFRQVLSAAGGLLSGDKVALDLEAGSNDLLVWAAECLALLRDSLGVTPFLYTGEWFALPHNLEDHAPSLGMYPLWWASYTAIEPAPPKGWVRIAIWQNSASAAVPGIVGRADTDLFYGTSAELLALGLPAPITPPAEIPEVVRAVDNVFDLTLNAPCVPEARRREAQAAIETIKGHLAEYRAPA